MSDTIGNEVAKALLAERKTDRRWRNIRFAGWMIILLLFIILIFAPSPSQLNAKSPTGPYVSLVRLSGVIMPNTTFSARRAIPELQNAFADPKSRGVVLLINSPGGSAVQASIIHDKILELKRKYKKQVVVVGEDALASGAYLISTAADKIYVNPDTLTGSIGVVMSGFGFVGTIQKLGITRRLFTAGKYKHRLDPFEPLNPQDVTKVKTLLAQVHQNFITDVTQGRGARLHGKRQELFSGDFWTGQQAVKLGLADGTANLWTVLQKEFGVKYYKDCTTRMPLLQALLKGVGTELNLHLLNNSSPLRAQAY